MSVKPSLVRLFILSNTYNYRKPCEIVDLNPWEFSRQTSDKVASDLKSQFPHETKIKARGRSHTTKSIVAALHFFGIGNFKEWTGFFQYVEQDFKFEHDYLYCFFSTEHDRNVFTTLVEAAMDLNA